MRSFQLSVTVLCCLLAAATLLSAPSTMTHQGRLLNASDAPVTDGTYAFQFSVFTTEAGGSSVWAETKNVPVKSGYYAVMLGESSGATMSLLDSLTKYSTGDLYLEITVQGVSLTPRQRLGAVPAAATARSLRATSSIGGLPDVLARVEMSAADSGALSSTGVDTDGDGTPDVGSTTLAIESRNVLKSFFERGDMPTQSQIVDSVDEFGARHAINTKGTGASGRTVLLSTDAVSSSISIGDVDRDGALDFRSSPDSVTQFAEMNSGGESATHNMRIRVNDLEATLKNLGLLSTTSVSSNCGPTTAKHAINTKGTGAVGRTISSSTDASSALHSLDSDDDGDGLPDESIISSITPTVAQHAINTKGTGAQGGRTISSSTDTSKAEHVVLADLDQDGHADIVVSSSVSKERAELKGSFQSGDVPTQSQFGSLIDSKIAQVGQTLEVPGQWTSSSQSMCTDDSTVHEISFSSAPGPGGLPALMKAKEKANRTKCSNNLCCTASNGATTESDISCDSSGARVVLSGSSSLSLGTATMSISASSDSVIEVVEATDGMEWSIHRAEHGKGGVARTVQHHDGPVDVTIGEVCDDDYARTIWSTSSSSTGTGSSVTIQASSSSAVHPIEVSGGAYCDGSNWMNASDVNLKENLRPVDGEDLLKKISRLPVSEWNYRSRDESEKHIGPTAQDFQQVFGVGSDGKSISTIDPSGIALAAIKQLSKENDDLKAQIAELKKMVEELARKK